MRTDQVHLAMRERANRYEICQMTCRGVHIVHKRGERMQDSINHVLTMLRLPIGVAPAPQP